MRTVFFPQALALVSVIEKYIKNVIDIEQHLKSSAAKKCL